MAEITFTVWKMGATQHGSLKLSLAPVCKWSSLSCEGWLSAAMGGWKREYLGGPSRGSSRPQWFVLYDNGGNRVLVLPPWDGWFGNPALIANIGGAFGEQLILRNMSQTAKTKKFRIQLAGSLNLSYGLAQTEMMLFNIEDVATRERASYSYTGWGPTLSIPMGKGVATLSKAALKVGSVVGKGGVSPFEGPWNDFEAPGWMSASSFEGKAFAGSPYSVGMGTSTSWNTFSFGEAEGGSYLVNFGSFATGETFGLPAIGASGGSMKLADKP